ncbi:MAG: GNAT family N-acetyltransferase, partial [Candidatus Omnitrophica bacterium]|nr:GNAT family N-acetyltransferase [Candidatus Omnitrophota bacterium]
RFCDHLIVKDKSKNLVVGTYRLLPSFKAQATGFHAEKIFDIRNIKKIKDNVLELGRSCVHPNYRSSHVINFLWRGISEYVNNYKIRFLFGCPRLDITDPEKVSQIFSFLKQRFYAPENFRVFPLAECQFDVIEDIKISPVQKIITMLPPLIRGYLKAGAVICGYPAINKEFDSVVVFMLLDLSSANPLYKRRFSPP